MSWKDRAAWERLPLLIVWSAAIGYAGVASYFSLLKHDNYFSSFDLANFDQALWLVAHGHEPFITQHGRHFLGDHFSPSMFLLAPIYVFGGGVGALLVLQSMLVALTAPLLFALGRVRGASEWLALLPAALWLASPLTLTQNLDDVHHAPIAAPFIVGSILALLHNRLLLFAVAGLIACSFKEDISLTYIMLGVVVLLEGRRRLGIAIASAATCVFAFVVFVFLPLFNNSLDSFAKRFAGERGDSVADVALWIVRNPIAALGDLATFQNLFVVAALVVTTGCLCLLSPRWMLLAVPALAHNLLSALPEQHMLRFHYWFPVMLALSLAGAVGVSRLSLIRLPATRRVLAVTVSVGLALFPVGVVYAGTLSTWSQDATRNVGGAEARRAALELIPDGIPVAASVRLTPHLSQRTEIYTLPVPFVAVDYYGLTVGQLRQRAHRVSYVVLDTMDRPKEFRATAEVLPPLLARSGFREIGRFGSVRVYARARST